jgi:hypothetical protein
VATRAMAPLGDVLGERGAELGRGRVASSILSSPLASRGR